MASGRRMTFDLPDPDLTYMEGGHSDSGEDVPLMPKAFIPSNNTSRVVDGIHLYMESADDVTDQQSQATSGSHPLQLKKRSMLESGAADETVFKVSGQAVPEADSTVKNLDPVGCDAANNMENAARESAIQV